MTGVRLAGVMDGSPAAGAGLVQGDLLIGLGGQPVTSLADLGELLRSHLPGEQVQVEVLRGTEGLVFEVILAERP